MDNLNKKASWLTCFNASIFLSPKCYPTDEEVNITMVEQWLKKFIKKFGLMLVESDASRANLLEFVETLKHECENKSFYEAWWFCTSQFLPNRRSIPTHNLYKKDITLSMILFDLT